MEKTKKPSYWYQKSLFVILFLIFFFPVGLFLMWKYTKWNKIVKWVVTGFFVLFVIGSYMPSSPKTTPSQNNKPPQNQPALSKSDFTYDVSSLIGKNIDGVTELLLPYKNNTLAPKAGETEWNMQFTKNNVELLVRYNPQNKKVIDFFIGSDDPTGVTKNKTHLLELGNLAEGNSKYTLKFVPALKDPSSFTGVIITPR